MNIRTSPVDDKEKQIDSQAIIELAIPILERALYSEDSESSGSTPALPWLITRMFRRIVWSD